MLETFLDMAPRMIDFLHQRLRRRTKGLQAHRFAPISMQGIIQLL